MYQTALKTILLRRRGATGPPVTLSGTPRAAAATDPTGISLKSKGAHDEQ
jgi:hypothetical protein